MTDDRRQGLSRDRSVRTDRPALPMTADETRGSSNLATTPFAGNVSSDTRAGGDG